MKIIAASIIRNEEKYIESMLESISWVDQIVLYNDHSTDKTIDKANKFSKEHNGIVHNLEPLSEKTMFSILEDGTRDIQNEMDIRNEFLALIFKKYKPDAVVLIDGDELMSIELKKHILKIVNNKNYDSIALTCNHLYDNNRRLKIYEAIWNNVKMIDPHVRVLTKPLSYQGGEYPGVPDCMLKPSEKTLCLDLPIHFHLKYLKCLGNTNHSLRFLSKDVNGFEKTEYLQKMKDHLPVDIELLVRKYTN